MKNCKCVKIESMHNKKRKKQMIDLKELITKYPECLDSSEKLRSYLKDLYPNQKARINIIVAIFSCGIAETIQNKKTLSELEINNFCNKLENDYGYAEKLSRECIKLWVESYGVQIENKKQPNDTCPECGSRVSDNVAFCPHCGWKTTDNHKRIKFENCYSYNIKGTTIPIGKDSYNNTVVKNFAQLPHLFICGSEGKDIKEFLDVILSSLIMNNNPEHVQLILIDTKQVDFHPYGLLKNYCQLGVISEANVAINCLSQLCYLMYRRYTDFQNKGVLDIDSFNVKNAGYYKYYRVFIIIDELADLIFLNRREVENSLCRLAQMGRSAGIHLVLATQRPTKDVLTDLLIENIPARLCFKVDSNMTSRIVLNQNGAENLSGDGDGVWMDDVRGDVERVQTPYITSEEVQKIILNARNK